MSKSGKLIFLDIDGTLTEPGSNTPPESALKALEMTKAKGNKVFLCTGRNVAMLAPLLKYGFDGLVALGGGYVTVGDDVIFDCPMSDRQRDVALDVLGKNGVFRTIEAKDATFGDESLGDFLSDQAEGNSEIERWRKALAEGLGIKPMSEYDGRPIYKVVIMCNKSEQLDEAKKYLEGDFAFMIQDVAAHNCLNGDLVNRKFDKGLGIKRICKTLGVDIKDTYGFGDSINDLEMIETVGTSVVMENGSEVLKRMADVIAPSVTEDGIYRSFEELGLI